MDWILNKLLIIQNFLGFYTDNEITWKYILHKSNVIKNSKNDWNNR